MRACRPTNSIGILVAFALGIMLAFFMPAAFLAVVLAIMLLTLALIRCRH